MLKYQGKSLYEYCKKNNLNYYTVKYRVDNLGISIEDAINYISKNSKYYYKGKTLHAWCKENGINYNTVKSRIRELGLSVENAVNYKYNRRSKKEIEEIKDWCKKNNYKFSSINYKMKTYGLTKEEAANWKRKYVYQINDESLFNYLKKNNYPSWFYKEIRNDVIEKNMSVQEAFNLRKERYYAKI